MECPYGILFAPERVNLRDQGQRIERDIAEIYRQRRAGVLVVLTVDVTREGPRLSEAIYRLDALRSGEAFQNVYDARLWVPTDKDQDARV